MVMKTGMVGSEQLIGYRMPDEEEKEQVVRYMSALIRKQASRWGVLRIIFLVTEVVLLTGVTGMSDTRSTGEKLVIFIMAAVLAVIMYGLHKSNEIDNDFLKRIIKGEFQVLDCQAYKADLGADVVGGAVVYVCTESGQHCNQRFVVDYLSAKEWTQGKPVSFLLMRALRGNGLYYELFTEKKLNSKI